VLLRAQATDVNASEVLLLRDGQLTDASTRACVRRRWRGCAANSNRLLPGDARVMRNRFENRRKMALGAGVGIRTAAAHPRSSRRVHARGQAVTTLMASPWATGNGPVWRKLYDAFEQYKRELAGTPW
jgi:hypothetical protein